MSAWQERAQSGLYDYSHLVNQLQDHLQEWSDRLLGQGLLRALGPSCQRQLRQDFDKVRRRLASDFTLVVAGDFKRGKSTLINALVGHKVASSNVTPETVTINRFRYATEASLVAMLDNGAKLPLLPEDIELERLQPRLEQWAHQGIKVAHLAAEVPAPWLQGVNLVDTPGMGDMLARYDQQVVDFLHQADSVIYLVSALSPLSDSEERFLRQSLAPHEFPKLTFVVNMLDYCQSSAEADRVLDRIRHRIAKLFPSAQVFGISALDELNRQLGAPRLASQRSSELEAGFAHLRQHLEEAILLNRQRIQLDRACELTGMALENVEQGVLRLQAALQHNQAKLQEAIGQCQQSTSQLHLRREQQRQEINDFLQGLSRQTEGWMNEFCDRLEEELLPDLVAVKVEHIQRYFPFFFSEITREALSAALAQHQSSIVERVQQCQAAGRRELDLLVAVPQLGRQTLWSPPWTGQETFQLVMSLSGVGLLLDTMMDKKKQNLQLQQYIERLAQNLPQYRLSLQEQVAKIYAELSNQILQELDQGYQVELEQSLEALSQAQQIQQQDQAAPTHQELQELSDLLAQGSRTLEELQQRLWFSAESLQEISPEITISSR